MSSVEIDYLGEGRSDAVVARRMIAAAGAAAGVSYARPRSGTGKQNLDRRLRGLNAGVEYGRPVLVLRDLDQDAGCPAELVAALLPHRHAHLLLRVCVRATEAWFMADTAAYARFCGVPAGLVPGAPEALVDPKQTVLSWATSGHATRLARHLDATRRRGVPDWAGLGEFHATFADEIWDPNRAAAAGRAPSLARALTRLTVFVRQQH